MTREELIELAAASHRTCDRDGAIHPHPSWHDLDEAGRREAFERALAMRALESALDPQGLSATGRAVLAAIRRR